MVVFDAVREGYNEAGLSILPVRADGSKAPDTSTWREFTKTRASVEQMRAWDFPSRCGFGVIAGPASGFRESWDFDAADVFEGFVAAAQACGLGEVVARIRAGYEDMTPSGGRRWLVTYPADVTWKDCTLARRPGRPSEPDVKVLIELPTYAICAPSNGTTHPSGGAYVRCSGNFTTIASYTVAERDALIALARTFDQMPRREYESTGKRPRVASDVKPGDDFNARASWPDLLPDWTEAYRRGDVVYLCRPGKDHGVSATINALGTDRLHVFTSSTAFDPDTSYSKFGAYAVLHHGGDFARAALALAKQGYGQSDVPETTQANGSGNLPAAGTAGTIRPARPSTVPVFAKPAVAASERSSYVLLPKEEYDGWFARGTINLIGGSSGAGKTTLTLDLLRSQARGGTYLGHVGARLDFLVLFADRGSISNAETLQRMRIDPETVPIDHIPVPEAGGAEAIGHILAAIERQPTLPAVVFVEGADMLLEDPCKTQCVSPFLKGLRTIAEHYHLALVLSVGASKAKPHEQYALKRDRVFGSQAWTRMSDTVLVMSITGDGTIARRELDVLHRNAAAETFKLEFSGGLLVASAPSAPASDTDVLTWIRDVEAFTKTTFRSAFGHLSGARVNDLLDGLVRAGVLKAKTGSDGKTRYIFRRPPHLNVVQSNAILDKNERADFQPEVVQKAFGLDTKTETTPTGFPKKFEVHALNSLKPPFLSSMSKPSSPIEGVLDLDSQNEGIRAREAVDHEDDLPACLRDLTPDDTDPIDEHDDERN